MERTCCSSMARRTPMQEAGHSSARAFLPPAAAAMRPLTSFQTACPVGNGPCWLDASSNRARVITALRSGNETSPLEHMVHRYGQTLCDTILKKQCCCTYELSCEGASGDAAAGCCAACTYCPLQTVMCSAPNTSACCFSSACACLDCR